MKKIILPLLPFFLFLNESKAQKPDFGASTEYAVFTTTGAFDNLGATSITGNIGTNVGAFTGFPPGNVIGETHIADAISLQVSIDLDIAYSFMTSLTCDTTIGTSLGSNQILPPHVYCISGISTLTGNLTLDAKGDPNALFIFKMDAAFSTAIFSTITLINSASVCNIFWQINGACILGEGSLFKGNLIANGAISLLEASTVHGKTLSRAGAIDLHNNALDLDPDACLTPADLPIQLLSFTAQCDSENAILNWTSASETNNDFYTLERSADDFHWETVEVMNGAGNSIQQTDYTFIDGHPLFSNAFYRLLQTDYNGNAVMIKTVSIENCHNEKKSFDIYPNPTTGFIQLDMKPDLFISISVFDLQGSVIFYSTTFVSSFDLKDGTAGIYFVQLQSKNGFFTQKMILE